VSVTRFCLGLTHRNRTTRQERTIQTQDRFLSILVRTHFHERKSTRSASGSVRDDVYYLNRPVASERGPKILLGCTAFHISDIKVLHDFLGSVKVGGSKPSPILGKAETEDRLRIAIVRGMKGALSPRFTRKTGDAKRRLVLA
jgi:hypothetical protein